MRLLVTMSRDWDDDNLFYEALDRYVPLADPFIIVHGDEPKGEGRLVRAYIDMHGNGATEVVHEPHPADWATYGKAAGFRRNAEMVATKPALCLAFIKNGSRGATHCADLADRSGIPTYRFRPGRAADTGRRAQ